MKKNIELEELKSIQLDILSCVHQFCIEKGINYSISSGTLIGAVRHKGYIPWDDDIDIYMLRPDFQRFENEFLDLNYRVMSPDLDESCIYPYAKVYDSRTVLKEDLDYSMDNLGVNIDLFIIDSVPDDIKERKRVFRINTILDYILILKTLKYRKAQKIWKNILLYLGKSLLVLIPLRWAIKKKVYLCQPYNPNAKDICNVMAGGGINACISKDLMENFIDIEFEGRTFKCMKDYDNYLRLNYGDYMQLPPEKERVSMHIFKAYWK